jgi:hypothetical protein
MNQIIETKQSENLSVPIKFSFVKWFDNFVTWVFGIVFLLSGIPHWGNPYFFLGSVYAYNWSIRELGKSRQSECR